MDWDDLKFAFAVARHGSLSAAARVLGTTQPTVSRRLDGLERRIGVKLFERGASGLSPTPLCAALVDGLQRMEDGALAVERRIAARDTGLQGAISVTSLDWLGDGVIAPIAARFGALHPLVAVELLVEPRVFNLSRREADIAFRFGPFQQEDLVERKVAEIGYGLYAAPAYLDRHGKPDFATDGGPAAPAGRRAGDAPAHRHAAARSNPAGADGGACRSAGRAAHPCLHRLRGRDAENPRGGTQSGLIIYTDSYGIHTKLADGRRRASGPD